MSHNITLKDVYIRDLDMFGDVCESITDGKATLVKDATTFRTYQGQPNKCHAKIKMPGSHDIGLLQQEDGSYTPVYDPYMLSGCLTAPGQTRGIGLALQEYTLREAEYEASRLGYSTARVPGDGGVVLLEMTKG